MRKIIFTIIFLCFSFFNKNFGANETPLPDAKEYVKLTALVDGMTNSSTTQPESIVTSEKLNKPSKPDFFPSNAGICEISQVNDPTMHAVASGIWGGPVTVASGATSQFTLSMSSTTVVPGQAHTITLNRVIGSGGFLGLLLYVKDLAGNHIGTFTTVPGSTQTHPSSGLFNSTGCSVSNLISTLTHVTGSSFLATQTFTWTAPETIAGGIVTIEAIAFDSSSLIYNVPTPLSVPVNSTLSNGFLEISHVSVTAQNGSFVSLDESLTIEVYNTLGQKVANESLANGLYTIVVSNVTGEQAVLKKII